MLDGYQITYERHQCLPSNYFGALHSLRILIMNNVEILCQMKVYYAECRIVKGCYSPRKKNLRAIDAATSALCSLFCCSFHCYLRTNWTWHAICLSIFELKYLGVRMVNNGCCCFHLRNKVYRRKHVTSSRNYLLEIVHPYPTRKRIDHKSDWEYMFSIKTGSLLGEHRFNRYCAIRFLFQLMAININDKIFEGLTIKGQLIIPN